MDNFKNNVQTKDQKAFKDWMNVTIRKIERLAIQYGLSSKDAGLAAELVFRELYSRLEELVDRMNETELYRNALNVLERFQTDSSEEQLFSFQEDNELHGRIRALPPEYRIPFILFQFHSKSNIEIVEITGLTEQQVDTALQQSTSPNRRT